MSTQTHEQYYVPAQSKWPIVATIALLVTFFGLGTWFNDLKAERAESSGPLIFFIGALLIQHWFNHSGLSLICLFHLLNQMMWSVSTQPPIVFRGRIGRLVLSSWTLRRTSGLLEHRSSSLHLPATQ